MATYNNISSIRLTGNYINNNNHNHNHNNNHNNKNNNIHQGGMRHYDGYNIVDNDANDLVLVTENYTFRRIRLNDLELLKKLQSELFPVRYDEEFYRSLLNTNETYTILAFTNESHCSETAHKKLVGVCTCKVYENKPIIFAKLRNIKSKIWNFFFASTDYEQNESKTPIHRYGYIMTLGVTLAHRRRGLASQMLAIIEKEMSRYPYQCSRLTLHCKVDNVNALNFYHKHGFRIEFRFLDYYDFNGVKEDAFQLVKDLQITPPLLEGSFPHGQAMTLHQGSNEGNKQDRTLIMNELFWWYLGLIYVWVSIVFSWLLVIFARLSDIIEENVFCWLYSTKSNPSDTHINTSVIHVQGTNIIPSKSRHHHEYESLSSSTMHNK